MIIPSLTALLPNCAAKYTSVYTLPSSSTSLELTTHPYAISSISSSASSSSSSVFSLDSSASSVASSVTSSTDLDEKCIYLGTQPTTSAVPVLSNHLDQNLPSLGLYCGLPFDRKRFQASNEVHVSDLQEQALRALPLPAAELRNPRRSKRLLSVENPECGSNNQCSVLRPPPLLRHHERKLHFVDNLVDTSARIVETIWSTTLISKSECDNKILPIRTFIQETLRRSRTSYSTLQVALYYLLLIKPHIQTMASSVENEGTQFDRALYCGRRMFLASLILASKYLQDRNYSARAWSKISGLQTIEINRNEMVFLMAIDWRLHISEPIFEKWTKFVLNSISTSYQEHKNDIHSSANLIAGLTPDLNSINVGQEDTQIQPGLCISSAKPDRHAYASSATSSVKLENPSQDALRVMCKISDSTLNQIPAVNLNEKQYHQRLQTQDGFRSFALHEPSKPLSEEVPVLGFIASGSACANYEINEGFDLPVPPEIISTSQKSGSVLSGSMQRHVSRSFNYDFLYRQAAAYDSSSDEENSGSPSLPYHRTKVSSGNSHMSAYSNLAQYKSNKRRLDDPHLMETEGSPQVSYKQSNITPIMQHCLLEHLGEHTNNHVTIRRNVPISYKRLCVQHTEKDIR